ncbi:MAG: hypothetical protein B7Z20_07335 [Sphingobium sp. 32-64-5]|nr:MAG: hypothetical protein B7Z20_07335 [Sphingobium sp. 32-64-5]
MDPAIIMPIALQTRPAAPRRWRLVLAGAVALGLGAGATCASAASDKTARRLSLYLPGIDARTAPPPDATEAAEPVDSRTRITEDPDGLTADAPGPFDRVVDLWPERVELARTTATGAFKTLLVSDYDPARGTARMFLGTAADITTYDLKRIYMGECTVALKPPRGRRSR